MECIDEDAKEKEDGEMKEDEEDENWKREEEKAEEKIMEGLCLVKKNVNIK